MGIHTAIDTNGYYGDRVADAELEAMDLVMLGIKAWARIATSGSRGWQSARRWISHAVSPPTDGRSGCASSWCLD